MAPAGSEDWLEYLKEIVKVEGWFLWTWLQDHPSEPLVDVLRKRFYVFGKMPFHYSRNYELDERLGLEPKVERLFKKHSIE